MMKKILFVFGLLAVLAIPVLACDVNITSIPYTSSLNSTTFCLNQSIYSTGHGIQLEGHDNILDCQGFTVEGSQSGKKRGIGFVDSLSYNNTAQNCVVFNYDKMIGTYGGSYNNTFLNIAVYSNNTAISGRVGVWEGGILNNYINVDIYSTRDGLWVEGTNSSNISGGSINDNANQDYKLVRNGTAYHDVYIRDTNFTDKRKILFYYGAEEFIYNNNPSGELWLNSTVSGATTIERVISDWSDTYMKWNDSGTVTMTYSITGLKADGRYEVYDNSVLDVSLRANSAGTLPSFSIGLASEHEIEVMEVDPPLDPMTSSVVGVILLIFTLSTVMITIRLLITENLTIENLIKVVMAVVVGMAGTIILLGLI